MSWMNLLGNAALGYGVDKLSGGKGGIGAALGGLAGGTGYGLNMGGLMGNGSIMQEGLGNMVNSTGLFGQGLTKDQTAYNEAYKNIGSEFLGDSAIRESLNQGYQNLPAAQSGFGSTIAGLGNKYGDTVGLLGDLGTTYGQISGGLAQRKNSQAEIDYRNRLAAMQERDFNRSYANQDATNQAALDAFKNSSLNNYYTT